MSLARNIEAKKKPKQIRANRVIKERDIYTRGDETVLVLQSNNEEGKPNEFSVLSLGNYQVKQLNEDGKLYQEIIQRMKITPEDIEEDPDLRYLWLIESSYFVGMKYEREATKEEFDSAIILAEQMFESATELAESAPSTNVSQAPMEEDDDSAAQRPFLSELYFCTDDERTEDRVSNPLPAETSFEVVLTPVPVVTDESGEFFRVGNEGKDNKAVIFTNRVTIEGSQDTMPGPAVRAINITTGASKTLRSHEAAAIEITLKSVNSVVDSELSLPHEPNKVIASISKLGDGFCVKTGSMATATVRAVKILPDLTETKLSQVGEKVENDSKIVDFDNHIIVYFNLLKEARAMFIFKVSKAAASADADMEEEAPPAPNPLPGPAARQAPNPLPGPAARQAPNPLPGPAARQAPCVIIKDGSKETLTALDYCNSWESVGERKPEGREFDVPKTSPYELEVVGKDEGWPRNSFLNVWGNASLSTTQEAKGMFELRKDAMVLNQIGYYPLTLVSNSKTYSITPYGWTKYTLDVNGQSWYLICFINGSRQIVAKHTMWMTYDQMVYIGFETVTEHRLEFTQNMSERDRLKSGGYPGAIDEFSSQDRLGSKNFRTLTEWTCSKSLINSTAASDRVLKLKDQKDLSCDMKHFGCGQAKDGRGQGTNPSALEMVGDHVVCLGLHGKDAGWNIHTLCSGCNAIKDQKHDSFLSSLLISNPNSMRFMASACLISATRLLALGQDQVMFEKVISGLQESDYGEAFLEEMGFRNEFIVDFKEWSALKSQSSDGLATINSMNKLYLKKPRHKVAGEYPVAWTYFACSRKETNEKAVMLKKSEDMSKVRLMDWHGDPSTPTPEREADSKWITYMVNNFKIFFRYLTEDITEEDKENKKGYPVVTLSRLIELHGAAENDKEKNKNLRLGSDTVFEDESKVIYPYIYDETTRLAILPPAQKVVHL